LIHIAALLSIAVPSISGILLFPLSRRASEIISQISSAITLAFTLLTAYLFASSGFTTTEVALVYFNRIKLYSIIIDSLSVIVALAVSMVGYLILLFSLGYMSPKNKEHPVEEGFQRYYGTMLLFMGSMLGFVFSGTFLGLILFFELTGLCSWILIAFYRGKEDRMKATKALLFTHLGGLFLVATAAIVFYAAQDFSIGSLGRLDEGARGIAVLMLLISAWAKSAQIPFCSWLPDAMVAPTPVSAYLHAAAMVKVGVYLMARVIPASLPLPSFVPIVAGIFSAATMVFGLLMYFPQVDMKRLLAYSTITQLSYMFLGLSFAMTGSIQGYSGALMHLFNHAFAKGLFFLVSGALSATAGSKLLTDYSGIVSRNRLLGASFAVATMSIAGIPPFNIFFSKFTIISAGFSLGGLFSALSAISIVESVLCFIWFLRWFISCCLGEESDIVRSMDELDPRISSSLAIFLIFCLFSQFVVIYLFPRGVWPW